MGWYLPDSYLVLLGHVALAALTVAALLKYHSAKVRLVNWLIQNNASEWEALGSPRVLESISEAEREELSSAEPQMAALRRAEHRRRRLEHYLLLGRGTADESGAEGLFGAARLWLRISSALCVALSALTLAQFILLV